MLWLKWIVFTLVCPAGVTLWLPFLLLGPRSFQIVAGSVSFPAAVGLIACGTVVYVACSTEFIRRGRGTPAPIDPPKRLVVSGLYRFVRNPMYVGVLTILLGEAILFQSTNFLMYAGSVWACFHLMVTLYEEHKLRELFGEEYTRYCSQVNRWIPKPSPDQVP